MNLLNNNKQKYVIFFIVSYIRNISFDKPHQNNTSQEIIQKFADANLSYENTLGKYPGFNNFELNYENECSKYFKYHKNSKRDIVIFAYTYRAEKDFFKVFENIIDSFKHSIPKATIASVIPKKDINSTGSNILKEYGVKLIPFEGYENFSIVTSRYVAIYDYLKKEGYKYKKVFLSDIDDVYMFGDIFSTFKEDDIFINNIFV